MSKNSNDMREMTWDRLLWGVKMVSKRCRPKGMLIGVAWHKIPSSIYHGEPTRGLFFRTRKQAKEWCESETVKYNYLGWKFYPVRIREIVTVSNMPRPKQKVRKG